MTNSSLNVIRLSLQQLRDKPVANCRIVSGIPTWVPLFYVLDLGRLLAGLEPATTQHFSSTTQQRASLPRALPTEATGAIYIIQSLRIQFFFYLLSTYCLPTVYSHSLISVVKTSLLIIVVSTRNSEYTYPRTRRTSVSRLLE
jgi:hypothetical protein